MRPIAVLLRFPVFLPIALLAVASPTLAQSAPESIAPSGDRDAWYGLAVPVGLSLPPQLAVVRDAGFTAPPVAVPRGEEAFTTLVGEPIQALVGQIVAFSHESHARGERMWGRVSGFPAAVATADWVARQFRDAGLMEVEVQRYDADAPMWWPEQWEVRVLGNPAFGAGSGDVVLHSAVPARGVLIEGGSLTAPLVYAGDTDALRDVDVRGKVAIQRRRPTSGAASQRGAVSQGAEALFARGAVAVINWIDQPGNMHVRDFSGCAVCFNVGGEDGAFLRGVAERAESEGKLDDLRVRLYLDAAERTGLTAQNVVGIVPGDSEEVVVVNAHLDGWYDAAGDNADGLAVQVALARHFAQPGNRPARTLVFVASGGHHSTGLNGPRNFVLQNPELAGRAVLILNLEHIAQFLVPADTWALEPTEQPMGWGITNLAPALVALTDRAVERYGFRLRDQYSTSVAGDLGGYASLGVPRVQAIHAASLYHTTGDILETISVEGLERAARFYAFFIDGVARMPRGEIDP